MKIAIFKDNLATGRGADHLVCAIADGLGNRGHEVVLLTYPNDRETTFAIPASVKVKCVGRSAIRAEVSRSAYDIIIATGSNEMLALTDNGRIGPPIPCIAMMLVAPDGFFKWKRPFRNRAIRRAFNRADALQVLCNAYIADVRAFAPHPQIKVIREWADVTPSLADVRRRNIVVYPAAMNRDKNQLLLIKAFSRIASRFPDWELHLYGKANKAYGKKCRTIAASGAATDRIRFFDFTSDIDRVYRESSVMAFPSLLEGFPLTVIEGMSRELPSILVRELQGADEMVEDGVTGLISGNNVEEFSCSLARLMGDGSLRRQFGVNAKSYCDENFTKDRVLAQWEEFVAETVSRAVATVPLQAS